MNIDLNNIDLTSLNTQELREYENKLAQLMEKVREAIQARRKDDLVKARNKSKVSPINLALLLMSWFHPKDQRAPANSARKLRRYSQNIVILMTPI